MHQNGLVDAVGKLAEEVRAGVTRGAVGGRRDAREQVIHRGRERADLRMIGGKLDAPAEAAAHRDALKLLGQLANRFQLTSLEPVENEQQSGNEPEEKAQQPQYRHFVFLKAPFESAFSPELLVLVVFRTLLAQV